MREDPVITSPANARLKALSALRRRRVREQQGLTLLEGFEELTLALDAGVAPRTVLYCPELMADPGTQQDTLDRAVAAGAEPLRLSRAAFEKVAYREGPDGFLAVVPGVSRAVADLDLGAADAFVLVAEAVEKPGNLGAMLRTADAAGVHAVVAADPVTDWGNPNVVRASKGTVFSVPVAADPTARVLEHLARCGIPVVAATPDTEVEYTEVDYTGPVAVAVGAEKTGLSERLLAAATHRVRIPMVGRVNSLNVATSAALISYEVVRQRRLRTR